MRSPGISLDVPGAALSRATASRQWLDIHSPQDLVDVDCRAGHVEVVRPFQFALNPSRPQTAVAQLADPFAVLNQNLRCGRGLWLPSFRDQAFGALVLVPPQPLSERRPRYAAPQTDNAAVLDLKEQFHPAEPLPRF